MHDINVTRSGEWMMLDVEGLTDAGTDFVDAYVPESGGEDLYVHDAGRIVLKLDALDNLVENASKAGVTVNVEVTP